MSGTTLLLSEGDVIIYQAVLLRIIAGFRSLSIVKIKADNSQSLLQLLCHLNWLPLSLSLMDQTGKVGLSQIPIITQSVCPSENPGKVFQINLMKSELIQSNSKI